MALAGGRGYEQFSGGGIRVSDNEFTDWHAAFVRCPECRERSTWCAPEPKPDAKEAELEYVCLACNGRFYRRGQSFIGYTPYRQLSEWDQDRIKRMRVRAGVGGNSAVGAFG